MACGHVSNGVRTKNDEKSPVCLDCYKDKRPGSLEVVSLKGRVALCPYCGNSSLSSPDLYAFSYNGVKQDTYYDGCLG